MTLAVVILTFNEAHHIGRAIDSVAGIASDIYIIDSGSTDDTAAIARAKGAQVLVHAFVNHAAQFQWGLENAPIKADWIMRLDADEVIEPDLARTIAARLDTLPLEVTGVNLKRKHVFLGRWIKHGGRYPLILLRIWRCGVGSVEQRWMDEHVVLSHGETVTFDGGFADISLGDIGFFTAKHNSYATKEAVEVLANRHGLFSRGERAPASAQAARKRRLKEGVYNKLPFGVGPTLYFLYRYFWQFGFLDGKEGAIYHGLQGFWYRYLVDAKVLELERAIAHLHEPSAQLAELRRLTGLKLTDER